MTVEAIPTGYHTLTPYMTVRDAARAIPLSFTSKLSAPSREAR